MPRLDYTIKRPKKVTDFEYDTMEGNDEEENC